MHQIRIKLSLNNFVNNYQKIIVFFRDQILIDVVEYGNSYLPDPGITILQIRHSSAIGNGRNGIA